MSGDPTIDDLVERIVEAEKCFRRACSQILVLNRVLNDLQMRYEMAMKQQARAFRYTLRVRIAVLEGVRNMFYEYATMKADLIVDLRKQIQHEHENARGVDDEDEEDELHHDYDDEYDLSDSELEYSDIDFSDYDDEIDELNTSVLVLNTVDPAPGTETFESVNITKVVKETDLNGTEISIDSGYLDDSIVEDELKDL